MTKYSALLRSGEHVADVTSPTHGSQEWAYGYGFGEIVNSTHDAGNSVVLDVEPGGAVEPVLIESDITLTVSVLQGKGYAVVYNGENEEGVQIFELNNHKEPLVLRKGDAYYYLNSGEDDLILRDDSTPAFKDGDETQLSVGEGRAIRLPVEFWRSFDITK